MAVRNVAEVYIASMGTAVHSAVALPVDMARNAAEVLSARMGTAAPSVVANPAGMARNVAEVLNARMGIAAPSAVSNSADMEARNVVEGSSAYLDTARNAAKRLADMVMLPVATDCIVHMGIASIKVSKSMS